MSYEYLPRDNKQQNHPKVTYGHYLRSSDEPSDNILRDIPRQHEIEMLGDSHVMRARFRQTAQHIRDSHL